LIQINVVWSLRVFISFMLKDQWLPVSIAPSDADLEVCVMDKRGSHALVFPVRKNGTGWVDTSNKRRIDIQPTHWRKWSDQPLD